MWAGQEALESQELALHNLRSALESAVRSVAYVRLVLDDAEHKLAGLRSNLEISLEECMTWLGDSYG